MKIHGFCWPGPYLMNHGPWIRNHGAKCMISTRARASGLLTPPLVGLPPDPKIHEKSIKINENPWFLLTWTISPESWSMNHESWCKMYDFFAREGLRSVNRRPTPFTSGPQNPPKINKNQWKSMVSGDLDHISWIMHQESGIMVQNGSFLRARGPPVS